MENNKSFWTQSFEFEKFKRLNKDIKTKVCIIGAGITGISTAYYLSKAEMEVTILEKDFIGSKTTGHTTGKITAQHGLFYNYLTESRGIKYAKKYADANEEALQKIKEIIDKEKIDCDFEIRDSIIYSTEPQKYKELQEEAEICKDIGINASFVQKIDLPIMIQGGVKFKNQAQFNSMKYINGICKVLKNKGVSIYENTKVTDYKKSGSKFIIKTQTDNGTHLVTADILVIATRYPIFDFPGIYFIKSYQELEYAMCVEVKENIENMDMYLDVGNPSISYRTTLKDGKRYLLTVGNGAKTGEKIGSNEYKILKDNLSNIFGEYTILNKWTAEDVISLDKIPYIGKYSKFENNMYVATGFKKWGMTTSNIAARIIAGEIMNKKNKFSKLFEATRINPIKNIDEMKNMIGTTYKSLTNKKKGDKVCSHLGCKAVYNETTNTWDCPCHGSKYEKDGILIDGPSKENLKIK